MEQLYNEVRTQVVLENIFKGGLLQFILSVLFMLVSSWVLLKVIHIVLNRFLKRNKLDETNFLFIYRIIKAIVYTILVFGIAVQIIPLSEVAISLLASSGVAVLIIGFAAQEAFSNIISGFFISFFRPFSVGDLVNLPNENIIGTVEDITLRHVVIKTFENNRVIVPNSVINKAVIENRDIKDKQACRFFTINVAYTADIDKARTIILEEAIKHPLLIDARSKKDIKEGVPQLKVIVSRLGNSEVELRITLWAKNNGDAFSLLADLRESILKRFIQEGIEIPYPYQNIILKK